MANAKLTADDLFTLEEYARRRDDVRRHAMAEKARRRLALGEYAHLYFENRTTMHYQVQEMLRAERIFEPEGIAGELAAYNPLIPDGRNFKATMMLQYADSAQRRAELARLVGIERKTWMRVAGFDKVYAIADEDMERETDEKTSSVHFLRFEFSAGECAAAKAGASLAAGIDHPNYTVTIDPLSEELTAALRGDLR